MQPENLAVSVNPKAVSGHGNTEATCASRESVETTREAPLGAGEDIVRPPVKAGELSGNDSARSRAVTNVSRWDNNLIGFRGEEEYGVNADAAVAVGAFQLITNLIP